MTTTPEGQELEKRKSEEKDKETRNRILAAAQELFMRYGFKSITMDEIARHLGVSKKTIYQHFEDKDAIVCECIASHMDCEKCTAAEVFSKASNPVEEFLIEAQHLKMTFNMVHPTIIFELRKYHPKAWAIFQEHKEKWMIRSIVENLKKGMETGYYRPDIEPEILARLRMEQMAVGFDPTVFPNGRFELKTIQLQFIEHFIHGILTNKGRDFFNSHLQNTHEK